MKDKYKNITWIVSCVIVLFIGLFIYDQVRPRALGDNVKVEYLGKTSSGSWLPISWSEPIDTYYYGTDMAPNELASYFTKAKLMKAVQESSETARFNLITPDRESVRVNVYKDYDTKAKDIPEKYKQTTKKYIFTIIDSNYKSLKTHFSHI